MQENDKARLTGVRREVKYLLDRASGNEVYTDLAKRVTPKLRNGETSSYHVSTYMDSPERTFARAELKETRISTKIRVKEYYQLNGTAPMFSDVSYVEVKTRSGQMVEKSRFAVSRKQIADILTSGPPPSDDPAARAAGEAFEVTRKGMPLAPIFIVHYRRYTLQGSDKRLRITFDEMVSFHVAPEDAVLKATGFSRRELPPPLLVEPMWVVEVKTLGVSPSWLDDILDQGRQVAYSKFGTGIRELERRGLLF
jgi:hypothetical protein